MFYVTINTNGAKREISAEKGEILLDVLRKAGINVETACGGKHTCKKCIVDIKGEGHVLSCEYGIMHNLEIRYVPSGKY
jgi:Na+-transporting NADH:ubiquinone oxidoreductase subunit NqrF